jgi:transposase InsO family protein
METTLPEYLKTYETVFDEGKLKSLPKYNSQFAMPIDFTHDSVLPKAYPYKLTIKEEEELKAVIHKGLTSGQLKFSTAAGGCPVLFVKKGDGKLRLCIDYRKINAITKPIQAILPNIEDIIASIPPSKNSLFSKIDLKGAFNQLRIRKGDEDKTTFVCKFGKYKWKVIPFGLQNAPGHFQSVMYQIFSHLLGNGVWVYIDDILIYEPDPEKHRALLKQVLDILMENDLTASLSKCQFEVTEVDFLGYHLGSGTLQMQEDKVQAIHEFPVPKTVKSLQRFLGMCNYYRQFIPNYSDKAQPLYFLLKKNIVYSWSEKAQQAFDSLKEIFGTTSFLCLPDRSKQFIMYCDSSDFAIGAALHQMVDSVERPVAFFSRSLTQSEKNYAIYDKELLSIKEALAQWRHLLVGTIDPILIHSDHKNLVYFKAPQLLNARQTRWLDFFSEFNFNIIYIQGEENVVADTLSRADFDIASPISPKRTMLSADRFINAFSMSKQNFNYYTPQNIVSLAKTAAGVMIFDLDPASCRVANQKTQIAKRILTEKEDGLKEETKWCGHVFINPPYSMRDGQPQTAKWISKAISEFSKGNCSSVTMLLRDASGATYFESLTSSFTLCYLKDRVKFWSETNSCSSLPRDKHILAYLGPNSNNFIQTTKTYGYVRLPLKDINLSPLTVDDISNDDLFSLNFLRQPNESSPSELTVLDSPEQVCDSNWPAFLPQVLRNQPLPDTLPQRYKRIISSEKQHFVTKGSRLYRKVTIQGQEYLARYVATSQRKSLATQIHEAFGHLAPTSILDSVKARYWWPRMISDFRDITRICATCQLNTRASNATTPPTLFQPVVLPFTRWGLDFVQDLPETSEGNTNIITAIDYTTRYVVAEAVPNRNAQTVARFLFRLMLRFGAPEEIITDRASVFMSEVVREYLAIHATQHFPSTPFHPQTNGMVERMHGVLGSLITKMSTGSASKWDEFLPAAVFLLNSRTHTTTGFSPFSLVYGFQPRLPGDVFPPCIYNTHDPNEISLMTATELHRLNQNRALSLQRSREQQEAYVRTHEGRNCQTFEVGEFVRLKNFYKTKFQFRHTGPFIVDRIGANNYYYLVKANGDPLPNPYNGAHLMPWAAPGGGGTVMTELSTMSEPVYMSESPEAPTQGSSMTS